MLYFRHLMNKLIYTLIAVCSFLFASAQHGDEWEQKVAPSLLNQSSEASVPFLVLLTQQANIAPARHLHSKNEKGKFVFNSLRELATKTQTGVINEIRKTNATYQSIFIINAVKVEGNYELIRSLASRPDVAKIVSDPLMRYEEPMDWKRDVDDNRTVIEWGIEKINANDVWALGFRGQGVVIGGQDTGYEWDHPALKRQYRGYDELGDTVDHNYNWHDAIHSISPLSSDSINPCGLDSPEPCDDRGHGTHTMGTMIGLDSTNEIGVAPEAEWCACRNMERGWGSPFTYLECFQWFLGPTDLNNENPDPAKAPHVINNSWSCPPIEGCDSSNWQVMNLAVNNLRLAGIVVVVSAGNNGPACGTISTPAAMHEGSFSVGATAINDTIAGFSSRGPVVVDSSFRLKPNVSAPGVNIRSARPGGEYGNASGTSMAGPHVAGLVALVISANPDLAGQVEVIENIIEQTAIQKTTEQNCGDNPGSEIPNNTYGFGRVDALAAVETAIDLVNTETIVSDPIVHVFPNPVDDQLMIKFDIYQGDLYFELLDMQGKTYHTQKWNSGNPVIGTVDTSHFPAGMYVYLVRSEGLLQAGKIVKL